LKALKGLKAGSAVQFAIVEQDKKLYAEDIHEGTTANFESEPMTAGQLTALDHMLNPAVKVLNVGERVPDFALTDQTGKTIHLAQFEGKVVALTFGYSRCPNPNYCFRLSNNLARVERRFHSQAGRDLVLMTIMIDPEHDQGATLAEYAGVFKADPASWHFLTGPLPEIKQVAGQFGMNFWSVEGLVTHSLHTILLDRQERVAVNLEGNQFTERELGDLVRTVMDRP
jgi:protein SCO1/2